METLTLTGKELELIKYILLQTEIAIEVNRNRFSDSDSEMTTNDRLLINMSREEHTMLYEIVFDKLKCEY